MDPLRVSIALVPLGCYCLVLGGIHLVRRPRVTTGARDLAALGVAVAGLVAVGPLELFLPATAAVRFGPYVWLFMLSLYGLWVALFALVMRPRLVVFNVTREVLRPILADVASTLDDGARWAGDSLVMPRWGIQLHIDPFPAMRHVSLVPSGHRQDASGWRELEKALAEALRPIRVEPHPWGLALVGLALVMFAGSLFNLLADPQAVARGLGDMIVR